jgi:hypothetical protein
VSAVPVSVGNYRVREDWWQVTTGDTEDPWEAATLAVYLLVLPEPLPIAHGSTWTRQLDEREPLLDGAELRPLEHTPPWPDNYPEGHNFVSLRFWQVVDDQAVIPEFMYRMRMAERVAQALNPDAMQKPERLEDLRPDDHAPYRTVVEAVTFVARPDDLIGTDSKPDPLSRCIHVLTAFHRAYRVATRKHVPELTYERLHPVVMCFRKPAAEPDAHPEPAGILFLDNNNIPVEEMTPLSNDDILHLSQRHVRAVAGDPYSVYAERRLEAEMEAWTNGRARESIVQAAIAAEVLFSAILGLAMWEEHQRGESTIDDAADAFSQPLAMRIRSQYSKRFGGKWFTDTDPIKGWQTHIADVRHRVVHAGYEPDKHQAHTALETLQALERFIGNRLAVKWKTYPRTAWLFLGNSGFKKRGNNKLRHAEEWANAEGLMPVDWIRDYQAWREKVNALVVHGR